ncbi:MAG: alanine racemase [Clostridiales bacterium]|nr:alanine racemase [Clostridiales bacterium]
MKCLSSYIVDTRILKSNIGNIRNIIKSSTKLCAVVKANAYGVGLHTVCKTLSGLVDFFACANLKEALNIRVIDKSTPILILGVVDISDLDVVVDNNISISVHSLEYLKMVATRLCDNINVHIKVGTGLNRYGIKSIKEFKQALELIDNNPHITLEGVYSHFATKSGDVEFMSRQYMRFLQFKRCVKDRSVIFHLANSYGTMRSNVYHFDMVRVGMLLYGLLDNNIGNKLVVRVESTVSAITKVKKGESIGYDRTFRAKSNMEIAVIPMGYADGINRSLSNNFHVIIGGHVCPIVGLICMDVFMVDVADLGVKVGDNVSIIGNKRGITYVDYANALNTSPYELICTIRYDRLNYIIK